MPLPEVQRIQPGHQIILADSGTQMTPQSGYLEGLDRALAMSGSVARAFLLEPFHFFQEIVVLCCTCLCGGGNYHDT